MILPPTLQTIRFTVRQPPRPKARHRTRVMRVGGKWIPQEYDDPDGRREEEVFELAARIAAPAGGPHDGPVSLTLEIHLEAPATGSSWEHKARAEASKLPIGRGSGDSDNYLKMVMDALSRGGRWWPDDARIFHGEAWKRYPPAEDPEPKTIATVRLFQNVDSAAAWTALLAKARGEPAPQRFVTGSLFGGSAA